MKTKMNIICVLIFVSIVASFVEFCINSGGESWADMRSGWNDGWNDGGNSSKDEDADVQNGLHLRFFLTLRPKEHAVFPDSIFNETTGKWMPAQYRGTVVVEDTVDHSSGLIKALAGLTSIIILISAIILFVSFIRLILKINKSIIFHWTNVHELRWMGGCMVVIFVAFGMANWMNHMLDSANFSLANYEISSEGIWDFSLLILGLGVLLIAEIFAIGLRLQEEQELTI